MGQTLFSLYHSADLLGRLVWPEKGVVFAVLTCGSLARSNFGLQTSLTVPYGLKSVLVT